VEQLAAHDSSRDLRMLELIRGRADEALAGRTVWWLASGSAGRPVSAALACNRELRAEGVDSRPVPVQAGEPLPETIDPHRVHGGDVVILHGALQRVLAGALADAVRACGAHAVWRLTTVHEALPDAWLFVDLPRPGFDAYVVAWQSAGLAAFMPAPDLVSAKSDPQELGWISLLADVVREDHGERVGGTLHPRPSVAAR
jgi:hypothetical protein